MPHSQGNDDYRNLLKLVLFLPDCKNMVDGSMNGSSTSDSTIDKEQEFGRKYISCSEVARTNNTSSRKMVEICQKSGVDIIYYRRYANTAPQPFIQRGNLKQIG